MATIVLALTLNLLLTLCVQESTAQPSPPDTRGPLSSETRLFTSPDLSSPQVGILEKGETPTPIAETLGPEGATWYLVKSRTGLVGWLKKSDAEESKQIEQFFKALPLERSLSIATNIPPASAGATPRGSIIVPVQMNGPAVIVPVTLNRTVDTYMALDTGATRTLVSQPIASSLGLNTSGSRAIVETANGKLSVALARLASTRVGEAEVENLIVTVHNFSSNPRLGGLLGLDFLRHFHVSLDSRKQLLVLSPR